MIASLATSVLLLPLLCHHLLLRTPYSLQKSDRPTTLLLSSGTCNATMQVLTRPPVLQRCQALLRLPTMITGETAQTTSSISFMLLSSNPPQATDVGSAIPVTLPLNLISIRRLSAKRYGHLRAPCHRAFPIPIHPGN